ncbi:uncharacterized protein C2orf92 homolog isoform X1 [Sciurus carolinensis]|uniref:uncharacterized protein C2orf92 homolog isoform X1 n=1 Tax=Sciurus carolinensis TaxID=30640 RepID=UPI001FB28CA5|nr:uncharacterized protein C2orf92 homolog isoform X1 [Sciurus carolinensis]XP_047378890.1 uncharacterized protein C2orf92 homolog isoform X1 [Sciurus carolinensis]
MAKMSAVAILFSVLLDRLPGGEPHPCPLLGGTVLLWLLEGCEAETHREPAAGLNNTFSSSSKNLDKDFASIFDEILLQVLSKDPHYASLVEGGTAVTGSHLNKNDLQRNSLKTPEFSSSTNKRDDHLAKLFDEILLQVLSKDPHYASLVEGGTAVTGSHLNKNDLQRNSLKTPEFSSSTNKRDDHLAKLFDEILLQVLSKDPHYASLVEGGTAVTGSHLNERARDVWNSPKPEYFPGTVYQTSDTDHIAGERRDKQSFLFNRDVTEKMKTVDKETPQGTVSQDMRSKNLPCGSLLHFLQRNIVVATLAAAAILAVTVLLLLMLATYMRRKQPLYPPANMTYNIFIMNGKTWWQKSQDTNLRKIAEKQKPLKCDSCV